MTSTLSIHLKVKKKHSRGEFLTLEMFKNKTDISTQREKFAKARKPLCGHAFPPVRWERGPSALHDGEQHMFPPCALETERRGWGVWEQARLKRLPGGGESQVVWPRPSPPSSGWPVPSIHIHMTPLCWKPPFLGLARCTHGGCPLLMVPGPLDTSQPYRESLEQKDFQVTRTGARVLLIGSEALSEQGPRRKAGAQRNTPPPILPQAEATVLPSTVEASHASLPLPTPPPRSLTPRPEREASLLAVGLGAVAASQGVDSPVTVSAEDKRSE